MSKYIIEDETLTDIADQLRLELDTTQTYNPEDMPLAIHLAASQGGGGGGNLQKTKVLDAELHTGQYLYPLDRSFEKANLLQVDCILTMPSAISANHSFWSGFCDTATPSTAQQQIFSIGYRSGQQKNITNVIMPSAETPIGYWVLNGSSGYSGTFGVCYSRNPPSISTYFCIINNANLSTYEGAKLEIYVTHKV